MNSQLRRMLEMTSYLLLTCVGLQAQCPDRQHIYQQLEQNNAITDDRVKLQNLVRLEALCIRCKYRSDSVYAKVLHTMGRTYWQRGDLSKGIAYTRHAISINSRVSLLTRQPNLANSYNNLGQILADQDKYSQAQQAFKEAVRLALLYPEKQMVGATALVKYAYLLFLQGDYYKAAQRAEQGYMLASQARDPHLAVQNLVQQGQALVKLKDYSQAEQVLTKALTITRVAGYPSELSSTLSMLGLFYETIGKYALVAPYYREALSVNQKTGDRYGAAQALSSLGHFFSTKIGDYTSALTYYQRALLLLDDPNSRAQVLCDIGDIYRKKHQLVRSLSYHQQALCSFSIGFTTIHPSANPAADVIRLIGQKDYLLTVIQDKADTWLDYAKVTSNRQRLQYALDTYKVADQMIDFMRWEHTGNLSKLYWRGKTRGLYERAIETCFLLQDTVQAFRFFEKSRAVMLADKLNELGARQKLTQTQVNKENELRRAVNDQQAKLSGMSPDRDSYKSARMELFTRQEKLDAFLKQLEISNPDYYRYKYDTTITALADLRSRLNAQKASFVTYFVGDSALYVLGITADGTRLLRRPARGYQQAMNEFMSLLWKPEAMNRKANFDKFLRSGHGLYQRLLAPLNLPAGRVIVSPDGSFVPFETLSRKTSTPDYLVENYTFSYNYSARLWLKKIGSNPARHSFTQLDFFGVAPVDFAPSLKQVMLPGSDTALASIARRFKSSKLLTHGYATRQAFLTQAVDARVIHLFTHATADSSDHNEPKLYFADSALPLSELSDRTLPNTQLVVLAACKTGIGANQRGEGVFSLARGFAALGVPSVLTTLWSVQNDATYQLTNLFYKHLDEGLPKDIALQLAKKEWIETADGANRLPNYWAGLIIVGDAEPLPDLHLAWWGSFLAVLLMAAAIIVWYEFRKSRITQAVSLPQPA
ncbi:tetratricopeptide repeat protein [soil metagenome]